MKKKMLSLLMAVFLLCGLWTTAAFADELDDLEFDWQEILDEDFLTDEDLPVLGDGLTDENDDENGVIAADTTDEDYLWEIETTLPAAREFPALAIVDNKLYVIGGRESGVGYVTSTDIYDLNTKTWSSGADIPLNNGTYLDAVVVNNKIYVSEYYRNFYEYDPAADTWRKLDNIPSTNGLITQMVSVDQKIYIFADRSINIFDIETEKWSKQTAPSYINRYLSAAELDGKIYISGNDRYGSSSLYIYDVAANSWSAGASMNNSRIFGSFVAMDGCIYAIGGELVSNTVESYDPVTDTWRMEPSTVTQRFGASAIAYDGKIYAVGAREEGQDTIEVLRVSEGGVTPPVTNRLYVLLNVAENVQLSLAHNLSVNGGYDWSSTDETVAVVDGMGYVTAQGEGVCFIYAENQEGFRDFIPVKVVESNADELRLAVHLNQGEQAKLYLAEDPDTVFWTSFDSSIASVDAAGVVTANSRGLAIVQGELDGEAYQIYVRVN